MYSEDGALINPCPGLVVDSTGGSKSIVSGLYNEFYLNSHAAILGSSLLSPYFFSPPVFYFFLCLSVLCIFLIVCLLFIAGTSKPCRYIVIHDEIGFKLSEIELLSYWTTYLYCRATKSVSYATPAYYAHWASKRAKAIFDGNSFLHVCN